MRKQLAAIALTTLALALIASPSTATVVPPSNTIESGPALIHGRQVTDPDVAHALVTAYWTPERMRAATPADEPIAPADPSLERIDRPGNIGEPFDGARPAAPLTTLSNGPVGTAALNLTAAVGRVFFTNSKGQDKSCSGSTINNPTGNMVSTAGHCVHSGKGTDWHDNWIYIPGYHNGTWSNGVWSAYWYTSPNGWTQKSYSWWDFAFVNVHKLNGKKLVEVAGGNGISYNYSKWSSTVLMGYPADAPYDGTDQYHCQGSMYPYGFQQVGFNCFLTGGASGGPFFRGYDNTLRLGFTSSVIAHGPDDKNYGPYFDNDVHDFYTAAKNK